MRKIGSRKKYRQVKYRQSIISSADGVTHSPHTRTHAHAHTHTLLMKSLLSGAGDDILLVPAY